MQSTVLGFSPWMGHARTSPHGLCGLPPPFDNGRVKSKGGVFSGNSIRASVPHPGNRLHLSAFGYYADSWKSVSDIKLKASPLFLVRADARPDSGGGESSAASTKLKRTLELGFLFALWYLFNIYFNVYNKQVLKVYPLPATLTAVQFGVGSVLVTLMWILRMYKSHRISWSQLLAILPLAVVHTLGNLFTNMSLGKVAVSFTHTIKAMEPFFSVVLSSLFLHDSPSLWVLFSLVPIVGGVALASVTEASFNWAGFWSAMASNVSNQSRNVLSKKVMVKKEDSLDNITLFSIMTVLSFIMMVPSAIVMDGIKFTPSYLQSLDLNLVEVSTKCLLASLCFHSYQQVSYMILQRVSPVSHSVGNCVKRVVVIVSSVLFFHTPVSPINSIGTGIALAGVFVYSQVKRIKPSPKKAA